MSLNKKYQDSLDQLMNLKLTPAEVSLDTGLTEQTLSLYQGFVRTHYQEALEKMFPRLSSIWKVNWQEITNEYFKAYLPVAFDLNDLGLNFSTFLIDMKEEKYLSELSDYENAEFQVYKSFEKEFAIKSKVFQVNNTTQILQFEYDIAKWASVMDELEQSDQTDKLLMSKPEKQTTMLFLCRNPETNLVVFTTMNLLSVALFEIIKQVEISHVNYHDDFKEGLTHFLGVETADNTTIEEIEKSLHFLESQSLIKR